MSLSACSEIVSYDSHLSMFDSTFLFFLKKKENIFMVTIDKNHITRATRGLCESKSLT